MRRYPLTPDRDPAHIYDQCGCWDGSLTFAAGVNGGNPIILYASQPSVPTTSTISNSTARAPDTAAAAAAASAPSGLKSGDRPMMSVARPANLADPELLYCTKDAQNPVNGDLSDMGQVWKNENDGGRWDGLSNGQMFSSNDSTLHTWYKQPMARGFPGGGSGGQWFQLLPPTVGGTYATTSRSSSSGGPVLAGSPTHLVSTGNGQVYSAGWYNPEKETWRTAAENLLLDSGQYNGRNSYTWATLQCSGAPRRCFSIAWVVPAAG